MRRLLLLLVLLLGWRWGALAAGPDLPPPPRQWVTDGAGFLSAPARERLEARLSRYQQATGHQVLVWIGGSIGGAPLEDWSARTFAAWKIGRAGLDDGLALFILAGDRKLRIEVGYGLEERLPDALAARIIRETIAPRLRAGDRDGAVAAGVDQILRPLGGEQADHRSARAAARPGLGTWLLIGLLGGGFLLIFAANPGLALGILAGLLSGGRRGGGGDGGWSGGGGRSGGGGASGSW